MADFSVEINTSGTDGDLTITPSGELDLATAPVLEARLAEAESNRPESICVDMGEVEFIDSTGLRVLLGAAGRAREGGWRFQISRPTDQVSKLLELTRSEAMLEIVP